MNIKITTEEFEYIQVSSIFITEPILFGSRLYGNSSSNSDYDYLLLLDDSYELRLISDKVGQIDYNRYLPNIHQYQYSNFPEDYIITTQRQFFTNLIEGDSIINAEIILFNSDELLNKFGLSNETKIKLLRTYKVLKAFLGFAKRDIKKGRAFHASRCLYIAESLLNNELPSLLDIPKLLDNPLSLEELNIKCESLRKELNYQHDISKIEKYYIKPAVNININPLVTTVNKMLFSNNLKEFKY